ncbi:MAG: glutathione transferase GstA [Zoogloeaceae bacterium]|jgi:glutathione S-transferase|nr:glutathione transferase GstA [Zoogloeaceae bacterium]
MKLYYFPGACSLSPHIVACEAGISLQLERVDFATGRTESGVDFLTVNGKGAVPVLELDNGEILTEGTAIVQYLADLKPESGLMPPNGAWARYRVQEMLGYINSELHKQFGPLFNPATPQEERKNHADVLLRQYAWLEKTLEKQTWLTGEIFTVADAYLFTVTRWASHVALALPGLPALAAFQRRVGGRPAVQAALREEGLSPTHFFPV